MKRKTRFFLFALFFFPLGAFSAKYQIAEVDYHLSQKGTKENAVRHKILIDTSRVFENEAELLEYKMFLLQKFENTRAFEDVIITFTKRDEENPGQDDKTSPDHENEIIKLSCAINAADSKHLLVVPYPKYDSNSGLTVKLKAKDTNFLGNLEEMNFELSAGKKDSELDEDKNDFYIGAALDFAVPFYSGPFNIFWLNRYAFEYNFADSRPQFGATSGLKIELPFDRISFVLDFSEGAHRDFEYTDFDDEVYGKTYAKFSVPIKIVKSEKYGDLIFRPFTDFDFNYDGDGISRQNDDLSGGILAAGNEVEIRKIDWKGNFRNGYSFLAGAKYGWNFECEDTQYKIYSDLTLFKAFKYNALQARAGFNYSDKYRIKIGENLRGIADDQHYLGTRAKALKVPSSLFVNLDFPFHVVTTDWATWIENIFGTDSWMARHFAWTKTFDFELQLVPFADFALTKNEITDRLFSPKDGWYAAGFELLVFPSKWKSVVVRASAGFDIGRMLIKEKWPEKIDYSWREDAKNHEIYVGIGLLY